MKRKYLVMLMILALATALVLTACGRNNEPTPEPEPPPVVETVEPAPEPEPTPEPEPEPEPEPAQAVPTSVANNTVINVGRDFIAPLHVRYASFNNAIYDGTFIRDLSDDSYISWNINVAMGGSFRVTVVYVREEGGYAGFNLTGPIMDLSGELPGTGGARETLAVGYLMLTEGNHTITLTPTSFVNGEFAAVVSVLVQRVGEMMMSVAATGTTVLPFNMAILEDDSLLAFETGNIGFWCADGAIHWPVRVAQDGNYSVTIIAAAQPGEGGIGRFSYVHNRVHKDFVINETGGWGDFQRHEIGVIGLRSGAYDLTFAALELNNDWFMNLQSVEITRVGDFNPVMPVFEDTILPVAMASLYGEGGPSQENNWNNVGHFRRSYSVRYNADIQVAGRYELIISHAGNYGGPGYAHVGDVTVEIDIPHSGGWGTYIETSVGVFDLDAGVVEITIAGGAADMPWFMNHSYIRLVRQ